MDYPVQSLVSERLWRRLGDASGNDRRPPCDLAHTAILLSEHVLRVASCAVTSGLRERKKQETRHALSSAAVRLCLERGYAVVTVGEIADAAGVARRTFSNYFPGKAECVVALSDSLVDDILEWVQTAGPGTPLVELLRRGLRDFAEHLDAGFDDFMLLMQREPELASTAVVREARLIDKVTAVVSDLIGAADDDIRPRAFAVCCAAIVRTVFDQWIARGRPHGIPGLDALLDRAFSVVNISALTE